LAVITEVLLKKIDRPVSITQNDVLMVWLGWLAQEEQKNRRKSEFPKKCRVF
jgi:hypothetical protein